MEQQGVIITVEEPTQWVHSKLVNKPRNGDLRICIESCDLDEAIKSEHYQLPIQQRITGPLSGDK